MEIKIRYYSAPWCAPCKMFSPILSEVCRENNYQLEKIDIDADPQAAKDANVRGVPTTMLIINDEVKATLVGASTKHGLEAWVVGSLPT